MPAPEPIYADIPEAALVDYRAPSGRTGEGVARWRRASASQLGRVLVVSTPAGAVVPAPDDVRVRAS